MPLTIRQTGVASIRVILLPGYLTGFWANPGSGGEMAWIVPARSMSAAASLPPWPASRREEPLALLGRLPAGLVPARGRALAERLSPLGDAGRRDGHVRHPASPSGSATNKAQSSEPTRLTTRTLLLASPTRSPLRRWRSSSHRWESPAMSWRPGIRNTSSASPFGSKGTASRI